MDDDLEAFRRCLAGARQRYLSGLPGRMAEIEVAWAGLGPGRLGLRELVRRLHALAGSAGTFGLDGLGDAARRAELAVEALAVRPEGSEASAAALEDLRRVMDETLGKE